METKTQTELELHVTYDKSLIVSLSPDHFISYTLTINGVIVGGNTFEITQETRMNNELKSLVESIRSAYELVGVKLTIVKD